MAKSRNEKYLSRSTEKRERDFDGIDLLLIAASQLEAWERCSKSLAASSLIDSSSSSPEQRQRDVSAVDVKPDDNRGNEPKGDNNAVRRSKRQKIPSSKGVAGSLNAPRTTGAVSHMVGPTLNTSEIEASGAQVVLVAGNTGKGSESRGQRFVCQIATCQKSFTRRSKLNEHTRCVHLKEKRFRCKVEGCNKRYSQGYSLKQHIWTVHEMKKPFECEFCGTKFGRKSDKTRHEKRHMQRRCN